MEQPEPMQIRLLSELIIKLAILDIVELLLDLLRQ